MALTFTVASAEMRALLNLVRSKCAPDKVFIRVKKNVLTIEASGSNAYIRVVHTLAVAPEGAGEFGVTTDILSGILSGNRKLTLQVSDKQLGFKGGNYSGHIVILPTETVRPPIDKGAEATHYSVDSEMHKTLSTICSGVQLSDVFGLGAPIITHVEAKGGAVKAVTNYNYHLAYSSTSGSKIADTALSLPTSVLSSIFGTEGLADVRITHDAISVQGALTSPKCEFEVIYALLQEAATESASDVTDLFEGWLAAKPLWSGVVSREDLDTALENASSIIEAGAYWSWDLQAEGTIKATMTSHYGEVKSKLKVSSVKCKAAQSVRLDVILLGDVLSLVKGKDLNLEFHGSALLIKAGSFCYAIAPVAL